MMGKHQEMDCIDEALVIAKQTNIYDLNDDCLVELFSNNLLTPMDLLSLTETCTRFRQLIEEIHPKELSCLGTGPTTERILRTFRSHVSTLSIDCNNPDVLFWIAEYFRANTLLKRVKVVGTTINDNFEVTLKPIFEKLEALHIIRTRIYCSQNLFADCNSLTELEITSTSECGAILSNTFRRLERFSIGVSQKFDTILPGRYIGQKLEDFRDRSILFDFIERHQHLRTLRFNTYSVYWKLWNDWSVDLSDTIGNNCKKLEELSLRNFHNPQVPENFSQLQSLTKLRILEVDIGYRNYKSVVSLLQALTSLEVVKLSRVCFTVGVDDDDTNVLHFLAQLPNLCELYLTECSTSNRGNNIPWTMLSSLRKLQIVDFYDKLNVVEIIEKLTNLDELVVHYNNNITVINEEDFSEIVKIVHGRPNKLTLKCRFKFSVNCMENFSKNGKITLIKLA